MKKRWAMGLLCCLLLVQLAFPAKAAGSVYFVAAEESVLPVTDATMPFWANGYLYVPASAFANLGISVINNTAKGMTVLEQGVTLRSALSEGQLAEIDALADELAAAAQQHSNFSGKVGLFQAERCQEGKAHNSQQNSSHGSQRPIPQLPYA